MNNIDNLKQLMIQLQNDKKTAIQELNRLLTTQITDTTGLYNIITQAVQAILPKITSPQPYKIQFQNWSGSAGNYSYSIPAATHGKGIYPSIRTYVQNGSLWEETYDSPAVDDAGNVTVYSNTQVLLRVIIK